MKKSTAKNVVKNFTKHFTSDEVEEKVSDLLQAAMSSHAVDDWSGSQRADALFYMNNITQLIRAIFKIYANEKDNNNDLHKETES